MTARDESPVRALLVVTDAVSAYDVMTGDTVLHHVDARPARSFNVELRRSTPASDWLLWSVQPA